MEKKRKKEISEIMNNFIGSLSEKESGIILYCNDDCCFTYSSYISEEEVAASVATIFSDWFDDGDERAKNVANGILLGITALAHEHDKEMLKKITDGMGDDDYEDCKNCKKANTCRSPQAIKYRKANGIHTPKKHCKSNEHKGS